MCLGQDMHQYLNSNYVNVSVWRCTSSGVWCCLLGQVVSNILKHCSTFIIRIELPLTASIWRGKHYGSFGMVGTTGPSKHNHNPQNLHLQQHCCESLNSHVVSVWFHVTQMCSWYSEAPWQKEETALSGLSSFSKLSAISVLWRSSQHERTLFHVQPCEPQSKSK